MRSAVAAGDEVAAAFVLRVEEDVARIADLQQRAEMEERGALRDAGRLLEIVGDDDDRVLSAQLIDQVLDRQLDGAFVCGPVNHTALAEEVFFDEELVVLTAPHVKDFDTYLSRPNLKIIVLRAGCSYRLILEAALARRGIVGFRLLEFGTLESIFSTVSAGLGLTLFPKRLVGSACADGRVAIHSLGGSESRVQTVFIRRHDTYASSALTCFLDAARAVWEPSQVAAE